MDKSAIIHAGGDTHRPDWQASRLAELVSHLTDCSTDDAVRAVGEPADTKLTNDEALERVARAIVRVRR